MRQISQVLLIIATSLFIFSCGKSDPVIELTEQEMVDVIKVNFLESYGGFEKERIFFNEIAIKEINNCETDTTFHTQIESDNNISSLEFKGRYNFKCIENNAGIYNNHFMYFFLNNGSKGQSIHNNLTIDFDINTKITIAENKDDNIFTYSGHSFRNLTINKQNQSLSGLITTISNTSPFDFENNKLSEKNSFDISLVIHSNGDKTLDGIISKVQGIWIFISEDGTSYILE